MKAWLVGLAAVAAILGFGHVCPGADFNGDGTGDIAIFRATSGLWSVRGVTRVYFGATGDVPVPGDYNGSGSDRPAVFRAASGLWIARGLTRVYFGGSSDAASPGDYNGDGTYDVGIFRGSSGLWAAKGVTRAYFGGSTDTAIAPGTVKAPTRTIDGSTTAQEAGYYAAFDLAAVQPGLASGNIKSGVTVFGIAGDPNVVDTSSGTAAAADIRTGKIAWVDGSQVTGTIATRSLSAESANVNAGYYAATTLTDVDTDLASGNIKSGVTVFGIAGDPNVVNTSSGTALASDVRTGKIAWVDGSMVIGAIATRTVSNATVSQSAGYYDAFNLSTVDADLAAANIKDGIVIFGITGSHVGGGQLKTGQTTSYRSGDDGTYQKGIAFSYQTSDPAGNGQIVTTDNVTGLMWASDGNAAGCNFGNEKTWEEAIDWAEGLTFAGYSDWRLPNLRELHSLVDYGIFSPAINTACFPNTVVDDYWSGTTGANPSNAWSVDFYFGYVSSSSKILDNHVRVVRGGE